MDPESLFSIPRCHNSSFSPFLSEVIKILAQQKNHQDQTSSVSFLLSYLLEERDNMINDAVDYNTKIESLQQTLDESDPCDYYDDYEYWIDAWWLSHSSAMRPLLFMNFLDPFSSLQNCMQYPSSYLPATTILGIDVHVLLLSQW